MRRRTLVTGIAAAGAALAVPAGLFAQEEQPAQAPRTLPAPATGPDGQDVANQHAGPLDYLARLARGLVLPRSRP